MKPIFSFFITLSLVITGMAACQQTGTETPKNNAQSETAKTVPSLKGIDPEKAKREIAEWDSTRVLIRQALGKQYRDDIAKGFQVPISDLQQIVANIGDTSQLFAMLAIETDPKTGNKKVALIFQSPDKNGVTQYHDFTKPCPPVCPD